MADLYPFQVELIGEWLAELEREEKRARSEARRHG